MKKKIQKAVGITLAVLLVVCVLAYFVGGSNTPRAATGFRKGLANISEGAWQFSQAKFHKDSTYTGYTGLYDIPHLSNGFVPQGFCYVEALHAYVLSYYHESLASILSVVDATSGAHRKTFPLQNADGSPFMGHAGGVAADADALYLADGSAICRFSLHALETAADGEALTPDSIVQTDLRCAYLSCDGTYLYAGEFYTFTAGGTYDTEQTHHMQLSMTELSFSRCNAYLLSALSAQFEANNLLPAVPAMAFTTPNRVQGFARLPDGTFALSTSYGRDVDSFLKRYADVTKEDPVYTLSYAQQDVPVYSLSEASMTSQTRLPPMLEGIDEHAGALLGIFESGAEKYSDAKYIVRQICTFDAPKAADVQA